MLSNTCPGCGKQKEPNVSICQTCGTAWHADDDDARPRKPGFLLMLIIVLALVVIGGGFWFSFGMLQYRGGGQFPACQANLKNLGTDLELYATDHQGHYPDSLSALTPRYVNTLPTCHSAGQDTYSPSYQMATNPDAFTLYCSGSHHTHMTIGPNYPQYYSNSGLVTGEKKRFPF